MHFLKKIFQSDKEPKSQLPCDICGRNIAKYNRWVEIRLCVNCERVICNSCSKNLKRGRCDKCDQKTVKTSRILNYPPTWKRAQNRSQMEKTQKVSTIISDKLRYCRFCGEEVKEGELICSTCGTEIKSQ